MSLSMKLFRTEMSVPCLNCGDSISHPGQWFVTKWQIRCPKCGGAFAWTYPQKVELFDRYSPLK